MVFCPAIVHPNELSGNGPEKIESRFIGTAVPVFIEDAGPVEDLARAGRRHLLETFGIAVDERWGPELDAPAAA
jgi:hypothetical protein